MDRKGVCRIIGLFPCVTGTYTFRDLCGSTLRWRNKDFLYNLLFYELSISPLRFVSVSCDKPSFKEVRTKFYLCTLTLRRLFGRSDLVVAYRPKTISVKSVHQYVNWVSSFQLYPQSPRHSSFVPLQSCPFGRSGKTNRVSPDLRRTYTILLDRRNRSRRSTSQTRTDLFLSLTLHFPSRTQIRPRPTDSVWRLGEGGDPEDRLEEVHLSFVVSRVLHLLRFRTRVVTRSSGVVRSGGGSWLIVGPPATSLRLGSSSPGSTKVWCKMEFCTLVLIFGHT